MNIIHKTIHLKFYPQNQLSQAIVCYYLNKNQTESLNCNCKNKNAQASRKRISQLKTFTKQIYKTHIRHTYIPKALLPINFTSLLYSVSNRSYSSTLPFISFPTTSTFLI